MIDELRRGEITWGEKTWVDHNMLMLVRPGDPYSIQAFYNAAGDFVGWYVNLQDPLQWSRIGFDTRDHALDIIVGEDLSSWLWKDEDELAALTELGLFTADEAVAIRRNGEAVIALIESGNIWWRKWRSHPPDTSLPVATLFGDWQTVEQ